MGGRLLSAPLRIRPLTRSDAAEIAAAYHASYPGDWTIEDAAGDVERWFAGHHGRLVPPASLGWFEDGRLLGAVVTVTNAPSPDTPQGAFVIDLFVLPSERRRGIGRALMLAAMAASPGTSIGLRVEEDNTAARALYGALGFGGSSGAF
jgi:N-alpha-acetyltransferase 10/11